jgi:hypothetical protein
MGFGPISNRRKKLSYDPNSFGTAPFRPENTGFNVFMCNIFSFATQKSFRLPT